MSARRRDTSTLEFPDNKLLAALGGPHSRYFARLEQKLNVGIDMRGNLVAIDGKERERAGAILRALYTRLEAGESVTQAEVDAEIRFTDGLRANAPGAIKTSSSRAVRPRSPAQAAYLEMMRQCPLVFGIGPAGTGKVWPIRESSKACCWSSKSFCSSASRAVFTSSGTCLRMVEAGVPGRLEYLNEKDVA